MKFVIFIFGFITLLVSYSCSTKVEPKKTDCACDVNPPIPPPPPPDFILKESKLRFKYGGKDINFEAKLVFGNDILYNGIAFRNYLVFAKNDFTNETFSFALPLHLNNLAGKITIENEFETFKIGYFNQNKFNSLYTLYLGEYDLNTGRIYIR